MSNLAGLNFNANDVEPVDFGVIPAGDYEAAIVASEVKQNSNKDGEYLKLEIQIVSGPFQNRKLFENLNIKNPNADTVKIARGTLSAICRAVNVITPKDSSELHNKPFRISVAVKASTYKPGEMENKIKSFKPRQAGPARPQQPPQHYSPPPQQYAPPQQQYANAAPTQQAMPWRRPDDDVPF